MSLSHDCFDLIFGCIALYVYYCITSGWYRIHEFVQSLLRNRLPVLTQFLKKASLLVQFPGLWLGHSNTLTFCFFRRVLLWPEMCFGSLSCWNFQPRGIFRLPWSIIYFVNISPYLIWSIFPWISTRGSTPLREEQPHAMIFPPPCFIVGTWYFLSFLLFFGRRTYDVPSEENRLNLLSSLHRILDESSVVHDAYFLANCSLTFPFFSLIIAFL